MAYDNERFKASSSVAYTYANTLNQSTTTYRYAAEGRCVKNVSRNHSFSHALQGKVNLSYDPNGRSMLGASLTLAGQRSKDTYDVQTVSNEKDVTVQSSMRQVRNRPMLSPACIALVYYTLCTDNRGSSLDMLASYGSGKSDTDISQVLFGSMSPQRFRTKERNVTAKAEYTHLFSPGTRLKGGFMYLDIHSRYDQHLETEYSRFRHTDRQIHGYVQFNNVWSDRLSTDIGLRIENTRISGFQSQEGQYDRHCYTDLFPSVSVSWSLPGGAQSISLSYDKSISRPSSFMLDPYKTWSSDNSYSQGNPHLKPSYTHTASLYFLFLKDFIFHASYHYTVQSFIQYTLDTPEGYSVTSTTNAGRGHLLSLSLDYNGRPLRFWIMRHSLSPFFRNKKAAVQGHSLHTCGWSLYWFWSNTFVISRVHSFNATLSNMLSTPAEHTSYKEGWHDRLSLGLDKTFGGTLNIGVSVTIPIGFQKFKTLDTPSYSYEILNDLSPMRLYLNLSYTFGKRKVRGARDRTDEATPRSPAPNQ